jgi:putative transposase
MSNVKRLRVTDRVFFITINLHRSVPPLTKPEFRIILNVIDGSRTRLRFGLFGYVLMPDHWHALIEPASPMTISRIVQDIKSVSSRRINVLCSDVPQALYGNISFGIHLSERSLR